jgi:phosphate/sulfate permease
MAGTLSLTYATNTNKKLKLHYIYFILLQWALQPLVGFRPAQLLLSILSRNVLQSAVASGTSNSQLGGEPAI